MNENRIQKIPDSLQGILWSTNVKNLDVGRDKEFIIHQVLMYGTLKQIKWLFRVYKKDVVRRVFLESHPKIYTPPALYFLKNIILGLKHKRLNEKDYVKSIF